MLPIERKIEIYQTNIGKTPFEEWIYSLKDRSGAAKIRIKIDRIRLGNYGSCKSIGDGIFEIKIDFGPGYRVYFGQDRKIIVVLLCGGDKSTQHQDIKKAYEYWHDYRRRMYETK